VFYPPCRLRTLPAVNNPFNACEIITCTKFATPRIHRPPAERPCDILAHGTWDKIPCFVQPARKRPALLCSFDDIRLYTRFALPLDAGAHPHQRRQRPVHGRLTGPPQLGEGTKAQYGTFSGWDPYRPQCVADPLQPNPGVTRYYAQSMFQLCQTARRRPLVQTRWLLPR